MLQANDLRLTAIELRALARTQTNPDFRSECLMLADRYDDLATTTQTFMTALARSSQHAKAPPH
jgi:hypothetical protein